MICMVILSVAWFISSYLVSLYLIQYINNGDPDDYGSYHLCHMWIIIMSLFFFPVTFLSPLTEKWFNGEIVYYSGVMMTRRFWWQQFSHLLLSGWISNCFFAWDMSQEVYPGKFTQNISSLGTTIWMKNFLWVVPDYCSTSLLMMIHIWLVFT